MPIKPDNAGVIVTKEELLARLQADRQTLLATLDNVPEEALAGAGVVGHQSPNDVLARITAQDGEMLRRIRYVIGEYPHPPHDVNDESYWSAWAEEQVKTKQIMGPRGIKIDMAGTWVRLLAQIEALSPPDFARWLELDPQWRQRRDLSDAEHLRVWCEQWERSLPWWQRLQRGLKRIMK